MKIWHSAGASYIQGKLSEEQKINAWCEEMKRLVKDFEIVSDESDEDEISYTCAIGWNLTQKERSEYAAIAKENLKKKK